MRKSMAQLVRNCESADALQLSEHDEHLSGFVNRKEKGEFSSIKFSCLLIKLLDLFLKKLENGKSSNF